MTATQPVEAGDAFQLFGLLVVVYRRSHNPAKPWVDVDRWDQITGTYLGTRRLPLGIPVTWQHVNQDDDVAEAA